MSTLKAKTPKSHRTTRRKIALQRNGFDDKKLAELLASYRRVGELLEAFVGRERFYQRDFIKGLDEALQEVALKKTREVKSFADFIS
jgi:hypothetical protein